MSSTDNGAAIQVQAPFGYGRTLLGFEVIDNATGRPLSEPFAKAAEANGHAQAMNSILKAGGSSRAIHRYLRSI